MSDASDVLVAPGPDFPSKSSMVASGLVFHILGTNLTPGRFEHV